MTDQTKKQKPSDMDTKSGDTGNTKDTMDTKDAMDTKDTRNTKDASQEKKNKPQLQPQQDSPMKGGDDTDQEAVRKGADIENPDLPGPEKTVNPDDNPDETKRKIPNMNK